MCYQCQEEAEDEAIFSTKRNFRPGDEVVHSEDGRTDVVLWVPGMPEYDCVPYMDAAFGFVPERMGWEYQGEWELVNKLSIVERFLRWVRIK